MSSEDESASESEPELDCDIWDQDCKILLNFPICSITGRHLMPTCTELVPKKRLKLSCSMRQQLLDSNIKKCFKQNVAIKTSEFELIIKPFKVCVINNLIQEVAFIDDLKQELYEVDFNLRHLDLYEFFQSKDLKFLESDAIKTLYKFLSDNLKQWVSSIVEADLTHISATCSLYSNTDYLLVHDDQRGDRMVAFILYLTNDWAEADGGALQLINKDTVGHPSEVAKNLWPHYNQLVFFPVTNESYHQVAEIVSLNKCRLSINGWFHTKKNLKFETPIYKPIGLYGDIHYHPKSIDIDLDAWINDKYLIAKSIKLIQKHVEDNSEISLNKFFKLEPFEAIIAQLGQIDWAKIGPSNRLNYEVPSSANLPHLIQRLLDLFQSSQMFLLLHKYTDLDLTKMKFELQKWTPGNYVLLNDYSWEINELDIIMYFGCKDANEIVGARTNYVTVEDEVQNALITIEPKENVLNLIYRDSARFSKYFSMQSKCKCFYMLICSYSE